MNALTKSAPLALINLKDCREFMTITLNNKDHQVKLAGTIDDPYFCGKDVCEILGYVDIKQAIVDRVKTNHKKDLKTLTNEFEKLDSPVLFNSLGCLNPKKLTYHEGKAVYINEPGLYSLLSACKLPNSKLLKAFMDQFFYDLRYKSGIMDIFAFISASGAGDAEHRKDKKVAIDVNSPWFQELWLSNFETITYTRDYVSF